MYNVSKGEKKIKRRELHLKLGKSLNSRQEENENLSLSFIESLLIEHKFAPTHLLDVGCCCLLLSHIWLFWTPWTVAHHTSLSMDFPPLKILEWAAISFSKGSFQPRDGTDVFCIGSGILEMDGRCWVEKKGTKKAEAKKYNTFKKANIFIWMDHI